MRSHPNPIVILFYNQKGFLMQRNYTKHIKAIVLVVTTLVLISLLISTSLAASSYNPGDVITSELTHYCADAKCNGKYAGKTASGLNIKNGMDDPFIVACNWLPLGTVVEIDGQEYTVADRGGKGLSKKGRFDIFVPAGHKAALKLGRIKNVEAVIISLPEAGGNK